MIADLFAPLATSGGAFGLLDDAAVLDVPEGQQLVVTTDALVAGVHFFPDDPPDLIARKALRCNLSDLAAKGAVPLSYQLALCLPAACDMDFLRGFAGGLALDQREFSVSLSGGDTVSTSGPLTLAITAFGLVPTGQMIQRAHAQIGDLVFVSGTLGDAEAGLVLRQENIATETSTVTSAVRDYLVHRYHLPVPRLGLGRALRGTAHAALDISDGLIADLGHIARASEKRIEVDADCIPLSNALMALRGERLETRIAAAIAGDDYELAFTAPPQLEQAVLALATDYAPVQRIGRVMAGEGIVLLDGKGQALPLHQNGYTHF